MMDRQRDISSVLWTLRRDGHTAQCSVRLLHGIEMRWEWNGELYFSRVFKTEAE